MNQSLMKPAHGGYGDGAIGGTAQCAQVAKGDAMIGMNSCADSGPRTVPVTVEIRADRDFSLALDHVKNGGAATRAGWNAGGQHIQAQFPDSNSKMRARYLYLKNAQGDLVPWVPSQGDLFANDWALLP